MGPRMCDQCDGEGEVTRARVICPNCGGEGCLCDEDGEAYDAGVDDETGEPCGCPYCFCGNMTIAGEICGDCTVGAHQG